MYACCLSVLNVTALYYNLYVGVRIRWVSVHFLYYFDDLSFWYVVSVWNWVCRYMSIHVHMEAKGQPQLSFCRVLSGFLKEVFSLV